jgi:hypothetical protein
MKNRKKTIRLVAAAVIIAAVLALAFRFGGSSGQTGASAAVTSAPVSQSAVPTAASAATTPAPTESAAAPKSSAPAAKSTARPEEKLTCTVTISCAALVGREDSLPESKRELVPADGTIIAAETVKFTRGESAFDVLQRVCRDKGIQMESAMAPMYGTQYIKGIANLYEFDAGQNSGWLFSVNGKLPDFGCSKYILSDGDAVSFDYTTG